MSDNNCDINKWRLLIEFLNQKKNRILAHIIVITACAGLLMGTYFAGKGVQEAAKILTLKTAEFYGQGMGHN